MSNTDNTFDVFIVGGGPRTTYMLRQVNLMLLDRLENKRLPIDTNIRIAEPEMLGAGAVWSPLNNPDHQYCNTVANQLTACADQSVLNAATKAQLDSDPTFSEWLEASFVDQLCNYTSRWTKYYSDGPEEDNSYDIERWLDKELRPLADSAMRDAHKINEEKQGVPVNPAQVLEDTLAIWREEKLDKWFNEKSYGNDQLKCYKDGKITIHNDFYAARFLYGLYLHEMAFDAINKLSQSSNVILHREKVVDVDLLKNGTTTARIKLRSGQTEIVDQLVLLTGHNGKKPTEEQKILIEAASSTGMPQYQNPFGMLDTIHKLSSDETVAFEGMGLTAIDGITAATLGKGGSFERHDNGKLKYIRSGNEPRIYTYSISGIPLAGRAVNHKKPHEISQARFFTLENIAKRRADKFLELKNLYGAQAMEEAGITPDNVQLHMSDQMHGKRYDRRIPFSNLLPSIDPNTKIMELDNSVICDLFRDMEYVYYKTTQGDEFAEKYEKCAYDRSERLVLLMSIDQDQRLDFERLIDPIAKAKPTSATIYSPHSGGFKSIDSNGLASQFAGSAVNHQPFKNSAEYQRFIIDYLATDIEHCRKGNKHGLKAATDMLRDLRDNLRALVDFGGLTPASMKFFPLFSRLNSRLAVGPPHFRMEELLALSEAGVLNFMGPNTRIKPDPNNRKFQLVSSFVGSTQDDRAAHTVSADVVINTHSDHITDITQSRCLLTNNLLRKGYITPFVVQDTLRTRDTAIPGGAAINPQYQVIGRNGQAIPEIYCPGIMTEGTTTFKQNAARVGVGSTSIGEVTIVSAQIVDALQARIQLAHTNENVRKHTPEMA